MNITLAQVQKLLSGSHSFSMLALSMLITRWKKYYTQNPSEGTLKECLDELNVFVAKYAAVLGSDGELISSL
jgi:hypothetical protein